MATRKKAPAKGASRPIAKPASRSGSETRQRSAMLLSVPPGYTADLDARADAAGMTRSAYVRAAVEAYGGPASQTITVGVDVAMMAALSDCDGVPPSVRARVLLREVLGLWGSPVGAKAAE